MRGECHRRPLPCFCCLHIPYRKKDHIRKHTFSLPPKLTQISSQPDTFQPHKSYLHKHKSIHTKTHTHTPPKPYYTRIDAIERNSAAKTLIPGALYPSPVPTTVPSVYSPSALDLIAYPAMMKTYWSLERTSRLYLCSILYDDIYILAYTRRRISPQNSNGMTKRLRCAAEHAIVSRLVAAIKNGSASSQLH